MSYRLVQVPNPSVFDSTIAQVLRESVGKRVFVYVIGERTGSPAKSWCPDCVASDSVVFRAMEKLGENGVLVECPVVRAEYKGNPSYPYRTHPQLKITSVPTFIRYSEEGSQGRAVEAECVVPELIEKLTA